MTYSKVKPSHFILQNCYLHINQVFRDIPKFIIILLFFDKNSKLSFFCVHFIVIFFQHINKSHQK